MKLANPNPLGLHWQHPSYFDAADLRKEMDRIFDICHGCRLCFNLCPSFPALFDAVDGHDNEVAGLTDAERDRVVDLCFQCKLCDVKCPYTPPHEYNLEFPRVMLRARAVRVAAKGAAMDDRMLAKTDLAGKTGSMLAPLANRMLRLAPFRAVMEKVTGIDRRRLLPTYAATTFAAWWRRHGGSGKPADAVGRVVLFHTCSVNYNDPEVGKAAAWVLAKNKIEVAVATQECCGMPSLDGGLVKDAAAQAARNVANLAPYVKQGYAVVAPGPTCAYMMKKEWPEIVRTDDAKLVAAATKDLSEYLLSLKAQKKLATDFTTPLGTIAYHVPCHLKAQNVGLPSKELLALAGAKLEVIDRCSGVDGTWGMKHAYYDMSVKVAEKLMTKVNDPERKWDAVVSDCPLSGLTIEERSRYRPEHPIVALARAYGYRPGA